MKALLGILLGAGLSSLAAAQGTPAPVAEQIATAVLPLPAEMRAGARVLGYQAPGKLTVLREGKGMVCLADDPANTTLHVACYHESMEPFMLRGRELRAQGIAGANVDTVRFREAKEGKLRLPSGPAALYSLTGGTYDAKANSIVGAQRLYVVYIPYATSASTGISDRPSGTEPWLMLPGTPKAHIMFTGRM